VKKSPAMAESIFSKVNTSPSMKLLAYLTPSKDL
jgi:hypothetical protein